MAKEGWAWAENMGKAHYFTDKKLSLCGRWWYFGQTEDSNHNSPDNCKACVKKLKKLHPEMFEGGDG